MTAYRYICCADLGTTYSAVTYHKEAIQSGNADEISDGSYLSVRPRDLKSIQRYPGAPVTSKEGPLAEVPTELYYEQDKVLWGYQVKHRLAAPANNAGIHLSRFKLLLDKEQRSNKENALIAKNLRRLSKSPADVITEYLVLLLQHTKSRLEKDEDLQDTDIVNLVLTVPAIWDPTAQEIMRNSAENAAKVVGFGQNRDIFLVSEPSAAATFFSEDDLSLHLRIDGTFVLCDAGGGTVDLISYTVKDLSPLRIEEAVKGDGACCGSTYLNQAFRTELIEILRSSKFEPKLSDDALESLIESQMWQFETSIKRTFEGTGADAVENYLYLPGLEESRSNNTKSGVYPLTNNFMAAIFAPQLEKIRILIQKQLDEAVERRGIQIEHVFLVGGFAGSPALSSYLEQNLKGCKIVVPYMPDTTVARGGVLYFMNRQHSPSEIVRASYGFLQSEPYQPEIHEGHKDAVCMSDNVDGKTYVKDCIRYFIRKNDRLPAMGATFKVEKPLARTISTLQEDVEIAFYLYSNEFDGGLPDHYPLSHKMNLDCTLLGTIAFIIPSEELRNLNLKKKLRKRGKKRKYYYKIYYQPVIRMQGKNMRYELWFNNQKRKYGVLNVDSVIMPDLSRLSI